MRGVDQSEAPVQAGRETVRQDLEKMQEQRKTQTQKKREDHDTDKHAKDRSDKFEEHFQAQAPHSKVLLHANRYS